MRGSVVVLAQLPPGRRSTIVGTLQGRPPWWQTDCGSWVFAELCLRRREAQLIEVVPEADL